jgi:hypothetical protein
MSNARLCQPFLGTPSLRALLVVSKKRSKFNTSRSLLIYSNKPFSLCFLMFNSIISGGCLGIVIYDGLIRALTRSFTHKGKTRAENLTQRKQDGLFQFIHKY